MLDRRGIRKARQSLPPPPSGVASIRLRWDSIRLGAARTGGLEPSELDDEEVEFARLELVLRSGDALGVGRWAESR